jgi:predicted chitinase
MKRINRNKFFEQYPFRPLNQAQVDYLNFILDKLDESELITRLTEYAYILATLRLETANTFAPVEEAYWIKPESRRTAVLKKMYAGRKSIVHPSGKMYTGRGYVQLTHIDNYLKMNKYVQEKFPEYDLVKNPELACEPEAAWIILEAGMSKGLFTGKKLSDYFTDNKHGFYNARKIINGLDRAGLVQSYAEKYWEVLMFYNT